MRRAFDRRVAPDAALELIRAQAPNRGRRPTCAVSCLSIDRKATPAGQNALS